jgi:hypothetical protein
MATNTQSFDCQKHQWGDKPLALEYVTINNITTF